jgi:DNA polymerase (family 10)/histidinol-phosphatase (PHP family)
MNKMYSLIMDLHNHTEFSDGVNTIDEIIKNAIKYKISILGISDHYESIDSLSKYLKKLKYYQREYHDRITILKGVEIDISTLINCAPEENLIFSAFDYILIENTEYLADIEMFYDILRKYKKMYDIAFGLAHLDFVKLYKKIGEKEFFEFFRFIENQNIFFEINTSYENVFYNNLLYDRTKHQKIILKKISDYNIEISVGSDTHSLDEYSHHRIVKGNEFAIEISSNK